MTIKQYGGVFGRNPTFNNVTIDGELIINGDTFTGLDYEGAWNASTNTPTLASSTGTLGEFYIVSVAGATDLNGVTNWDVGDWALFNGSVWQRVEGGANGNFTTLSVSGLSSLATLDTTGNVGIANDGTGTNTIAKNFTVAHAAGNQGAIVQYGMKDSAFAGMEVVNAASSVGGYNGQSINFITHEGASSVGTRLSIASTGDLSVTSGNLLFASGKGIDFSATAGTGTSELLDDYEEGLHTATITANTSGTVTLNATNNKLAYTKTGRSVIVTGKINVDSVSSPTGSFNISLPFSANVSAQASDSGGSIVANGLVAANVADLCCRTINGNSFLRVELGDSTSLQSDSAQELQASAWLAISITYPTA